MNARWRLIDDLDIRYDAAGQMAVDLALLGEVASGAAPALRFYLWSRPALSLGRFQPDGDVDAGACRGRGVEVVHRPTGGRALLHGADLTYAAVLPRPRGAAGAVDAVYGWLARGLVTGLARLGVRAEVAHQEGENGPACFASLRGSDLRVGGMKLVGSAQVHRDGAVLQHGSVLLHRLAFDETDLLVFRDAPAREAVRRRLLASTVTLADLGADTSPRGLRDALIAGFAESLDLDFTLKESIAAGGGRR